MEDEGSAPFLASRRTQSSVTAAFHTLFFVNNNNLIIFLDGFVIRCVCVCGAGECVSKLWSPAQAGGERIARSLPGTTGVPCKQVGYAEWRTNRTRYYLAMAYLVAAHQTPFKKK